ncbi:hypothetical protein HHI36_016385 [Cryptolaemus montrouzieri]|uniref:Uncharacterized protein n=1 Tax=Cryptolaemus montrouzieri TaxID=559131 RepID=A0ABD2NJJ8_9CUCU
MFSTWCLRNFLLGMLMMVMLLSFLQIGLLCMNNKILGAVVLVSYIIFFQVFIFALCRDSIILFFTALVLLFMFLIACISIQVTNIELPDIFVENKDKHQAEALNIRFGDISTNVDCCFFASADHLVRMYAGIPLVVLQACCHNYSCLGDPISNYCLEMKLGTFFFTRGCSPFQKLENDCGTDFRIISGRRGTDGIAENEKYVTEEIKAEEVKDVEKTEEFDEKTVDTPTDRSGIDDLNRKKKVGEKRNRQEKDRKLSKYMTELRWITNVLGIMHILIIALICCYLYELLFGSCDHPYTYC